MVEISTETWEKILQRVKEEFDIPDITYRTWLEPLRVYEVKNNTIVILVTTGQMGIDYISKKFMFPLKAVITEITENKYEIEFILPEKVEEDTSQRTKASKEKISNMGNNDKEFEQRMKDAICKIDYLVEEFDRTRLISTLVMALFGTASLIAIWIGRSK